jgi:hypothetical protein
VASITPKTIIPPTGMTTRAWVVMIPKAIRAPRVIPLPVAIPRLAARRERGQRHPTQRTEQSTMTKQHQQHRAHNNQLHASPGGRGQQRPGHTQSLVVSKPGSQRNQHQRQTQPPSWVR